MTFIFILLEIIQIISTSGHLPEKNIETIGNSYTYGAEGYKVIFIHPRSTGGVLLELAEKV